MKKEQVRPLMGDDETDNQPRRQRGLMSCMFLVIVVLLFTVFILAKIVFEIPAQ